MYLRAVYSGVGKWFKKILFKIKIDIYSIICDADENNEIDREVVTDNVGISYTNEHYINIEVYNIKPMGWYFEDINIGHIGEEYYGIDCVKAYTSCLKDIEQFPVFNLFDTWEPSKNETIEDFQIHFWNIW